MNWQKFPKLTLLIILLLIASFFIFSKGLRLGVDLQGGTFFQIHLAEKVTDQEKMDHVLQTVGKRLDWAGLKDTRVTPWGDEFVVVQIGETNPQRVEELESLLRRQGKFEAMLEGQLLFSGSDIIRIPKEQTQGYGFRQLEGGTQYVLPFVLKESAGARFGKMAFHKCQLTGYDPQSRQKIYDCEQTYFFIDRPVESVLIIPQDIYLKDRQILLTGIFEEDIPPEIEIVELLKNATLPYEVVEENFADEQIAKLQELQKQNPVAIVPDVLQQTLKDKLSELGFKLKEIKVSKAASGEQTLPWVWQATGTKQVISLSEDVTGLEPYVDSPENAKVFTELTIRGFGKTPEIAEQRLRNLTILLESGSLPVAVDNVSKDIISPLLGKEFLTMTFYMGLAALLAVAILLFFRYRQIKLTAPMMGTAVCEAYLTLAVASIMDWSLDLSSIAGIVAAVGTGVNDQIIITDEMLRGEEEATELALANRIKRAFFTVVAAAAVIIASLAPIFFFANAFGKLVGFAFTTIVGVLVGILFTRPAYGEVAKMLLAKK